MPDGVTAASTCLTRRRFIQAATGTGYAVRYREFDGPHTVPRDVGRDAVRWLTAARADG